MLRRGNVLAVLLVAILAWVGGNVLAQPASYPNCNWTCSAKDVTIVEAFVNAPDTCTPGQSLSGTIYAVFRNGTNSSRYAVRVIGDIYVDGNFVTSIDACVGSTLSPGTSTLALSNVSWTCGETVEVRIVTVSWSSSPETCSDTPKCAARAAKCWFTPSIVVGGLPLSVDFSSSSPECDGSAISFTDQTTGGDTPYSYSWNFGDGATSTSTNPSHLYAGPGTYTVTLSVTEGGGATGSVAHSVTVNANPVAAAGNGGPYCLGETIELSASGGETYLWTGPDGFSSNEQNPSISGATAANAGVYTVVVSNASGCADQASTLVEMDQAAPDLTVPADVTIECGTSSDPAQTGQASATDDTDPSPNVTYSDVVDLSGCGSSGTITRTWTATDACGNSASSPQLITIVDTTPPTLSISGAAFECDGAGNIAEIQGWLASATGVDTCGSVTVTNDYAGLTGACSGTGSASVTFTATDACGNSAQRTAVLQVVDTTPPVAVDDDENTNEETAVLIAVVANDVDGCASTVDLISVASPTSGSAVISGSAVLYTPVAGFNGDATFDYTIEDCSGNQATATVTVTVDAVNNPPVAVDDNDIVAEDGSVIIPVPGNDSDPDGNLDVTSVQITSHPTNGIVSVNALTGAVTYEPDDDFNGQDSFSYQICDTQGECDTADVIVTVTPVNDPPLAEDDQATVPEDGSVVIQVSANDSDPEDDLDVTSVQIISHPSDGIVAVDAATGAITYEPNDDFNGQDTFTYQICDSQNLCDTATVTVDVSPVNDPPVANDDSTSTAEDVAVVVSVVGNDFDIDGNLDPTTVSITTAPSHGDVSVDAVTGAVSYTPDSNFFGSDSFGYQVCDTDGLCDVAEVTVTVGPTDDPPVAVDDTATVQEDSQTAIDVPANDSDPDGNLDLTTVLVVSPPAHGETSVHSVTGVITYEPDPNYNGPDSLTYEICDTDGECALAEVEITVVPVDDPPVANDDGASVAEDGSVSIPVPANDSDPDGDLDVTSVVVTSQPANGSVSVNALTGAITYEPDENFEGSDVFTYQICDSQGACDTAIVTIAVTAVDDPPVALDDNATVPEDGLVSIPVPANDSDPDGDLDVTSVTVTAQPTYGTVTVNAVTGAIDYEPNDDYAGGDAFTYQICDSQLVCDTAIVTVTVTPINDSPVALDDTATVAEDESVDIPVPDNDGDPDGDLDVTSVDVISQPTNGSVTVNGVTGVITYEPDENFHGEDTFTYEICDRQDACDTATVTVTVLSRDDPPVAEDDLANVAEDGSVLIPVPANDIDPDNDLDVTSVLITAQPSNGTATVNPLTGAVTYEPDDNFNGQDAFTYQICDSQGECDTADVIVTVSPVNDPPVAEDDQQNVPEDGTVVIQVPANDSDPEGDLDVTSVAIISQPSDGTVSVNALTGAITYEPNDDFNGQDTFTYQICDSQNVCDTATVTVNVIPVNDPPVANDDSTSTPEDVPVVVGVVSNDFDIDGNLDETTVTVASVPSNGSVSVNGFTGEVTYRPEENFFGTDSFTYQVCDEDGLCDVAEVTVTVGPTDDPPVALDDQATVSEDGLKVINVVANDGDPDGNLDPTSVLVVAPPAHGDTIVDPVTGAITYEPDQNYNGPDTLTYQVCDTDGECDLAVVTITVTPVDDPPVATDDGASVAEDGSVAIAVPNNDSDPDGDLDVTSVQIVVDPSHGTATVNAATGVITYEPNPDYNGPDSFSYQICDSLNVCDTAVVTVTVTSVDDVPVATPQSLTTPEETALGIQLIGSDADGDDLTYGITDGPSHGTITGFDAGTGLLLYTPDEDYNGPDSFTFEVCDPHPNECGFATVLIDVTPLNDPPVARNQAVTTAEDTATGFFALSIADPDNTLAEIVCDCLVEPAHGTVALGPNHTVNYTPDENYNGEDTFTYEVCDPNGLCDTAIVTVTVVPEDDPPVAEDDSANVAEDGSVVIPVPANDRDPDDDLDVTSVEITSQPSDGTVTVDALTGAVTYEPNADFNGQDTFTYQICDSETICDTATVTVNVTAIDDPPEAVDDTANVSEDGVVSIAVPANDSDPDDDLDATSVQIISQPSDGTVTVNTVTGAITYEPDDDFNGQDTFTYQICDSLDVCDTATVTVDVIPVNDPPVANDDSTSTPEDVPVVIGVVDNDFDIDGNLDSTTVTLLGSPSNGSVSVNEFTGEVTYRPEEDFFGTDNFSYQVCDTDGLCDVAEVTVTVGPTDDPPVALDDEATVPEDAVTLIDVVANDGDPDGNLDPTTVLIVAPPAHGDTLVNPVTGAITYDPDPNYNGPDALTYEICDTDGECDLAVVTITVTPIDDPPVAIDDGASVAEDDSVLIDVPNNDSDPDGDLDVSTVEIVVDPSHGTAVVNTATGVITYEPNPNYNGLDSFSYQICDLEGVCDTAVVSVSVTAVDDIPVATPQSLTTPEDIALEIQLIGSDADDDILTFGVLSGPSHGTITGFDENTGALLYTPDEDYNGPDSFTFEVCDPHPDECGFATILIAVTPVPDPPLALDDSGSVIEDGSVIITVPGNDSDPDGDLNLLSVSVISQPLHGTATRNPLTGDIEYEPAENYSGPDAFSYEICDSLGACDTALVTVDVTPVDDPIDAGNDFAVTQEDNLVVIPVTDNDEDVDGVIDPTTVRVLLAPAHGSILVDPVTGDLTYQPNLNYNGQDSLIYSVCNTQGDCDNAIVAIDVQPQNDPPSAACLDTVAVEGTAVRIALQSSDPDGDVVTYRLVEPPTQGTIGGFDPQGGAFYYSTRSCFEVSVDLFIGSDPETGVTSVQPGETVAISIAGDDVDLVEVIAGPGHGSLEIDRLTGTLFYTADEAYEGADDFTYWACPAGEDPFSGLVTIVYEVVDPSGATDQCAVQLQVVGAGGGGLANCDQAVIISEVAWSGTRAGEADEWIELRNLENETVDLTGWTLRWRLRHPETDEDTLWKSIALTGEIGAAQETAPVRFAPDARDPRTFWLLWNDARRTDHFLLERRTDDGVPGIEADLVYADTLPLARVADFDDRGEVMELINPLGCLVDTANVDRLEEREGWAAGTAWPLATMERTDASLPDVDANWHTNLGLVRNGFDAFGNLLHGTPGAVNSPLLAKAASALSGDLIRVPMGEPVEIRFEANSLWTADAALWHVVVAQAPDKVTLAAWDVVEAADGSVHVVVRTSPLPMNVELGIWVRTPTAEVLYVPFLIYPI